MVVFSAPPILCLCSLTEPSSSTPQPREASRLCLDSLSHYASWKGGTSWKLQIFPSCSFSLTLFCPPSPEISAAQTVALWPLLTFSLLYVVLHATTLDGDNCVCVKSLCVMHAYGLMEAVTVSEWWQSIRLKVLQVPEAFVFRNLDVSYNNKTCIAYFCIAWVNVPCVLT